MRNRLFLSIPALLILAIASPLRAQDAKLILEKAVKAHGGEENLTKLTATHAKAKGSLDIMGQTIEFTSENWSAPNKLRQELQIDLGGMKVALIQVANGDKAWQSAGGMTMEMEGPQLDEMKASLHAAKVESLLPLLKEKDFTLTALGESMVNGKPALGIKVEARGQKTMNLYFDKDSGLLVKSARKALSPAGTEVDSESIVKEYMDAGGIKHAKKAVVNQDGKKFLEVEVTEAKASEKLDDKLFQKP
jgi:hypothetical protein